MMKPQVARIAARFQVAIAAGTIPVALVVGLASIPFGWEIGAGAAIGVAVAAGFLSSLFIPIAGLVISWCWFGGSE